jgi:hypothetical protein
MEGTDPNGNLSPFYCKLRSPLNLNKMEELMDFITELHNRDREERAFKQGFRIGTLKTIKKFLENCPNNFKKSAPEIAALFGVNEKMIKPLLPAENLHCISKKSV